MIPLLRHSVSSPSEAAFTANRLDSLFDRLVGNEGKFHFHAGSWDAGPISVWQDENTVYVEAELPGVLDKDVELTVHNDVLKIRAERLPEKGRVYLYNGRSWGRFDRDVVLPESVDAEHVEASLTMGVLRVALPKHPDTRPRKIQLKTA